MSKFEPCFCCEKPVRIDKKHWRVHMLTTNEIVPEDFESEDSQGTFAIGAGCRKHEPHAFRSEPLDLN